MDNELLTYTQSEDSIDNVYDMGNHFNQLIKPLKVTQHNVEKEETSPIHMISQSSLAKEWLTKEEDEAWDHL